jgi:hypothetical protein
LRVRETDLRNKTNGLRYQIIDLHCQSKDM